VGSLLGGFSCGEVRVKCGTRAALLRRYGVKRKQQGLAHGVVLELGGPVRHDTKEGGARRPARHASGGGRRRSITSETGGLVEALVRGLA
jgi:hypothetical protein